MRCACKLFQSIPIEGRVLSTAVIPPPALLEWARSTGLSEHAEYFFNSQEMIQRDDMSNIPWAGSKSPTTEISIC
jgi:hypothetical protein